MFAIRSLRALVQASRSALLTLCVLGLVGGTIAPAFAAGGTSGSIFGTVTDAAGHPVADATVSIAAPTGNYKTTTDSAGHFGFAGVVVDTYVISISAKGFETYTQSGLTVVGDSGVTANATLSKAGLATIGRVVGRSAGSAFQPTQTVDSVTISGQQVTEALGKAFATSQTQLLASAPGTEVDADGNLVVRGSLATDIGLNYDGIDYTQVDHGGPTNVFLNGIGSATVTPGAGDPTQSNGGSGFINLVPKRGTNPAFGTIDIEANGPWKHNQVGIEYGAATPDNRFSNYFSYTGTTSIVANGQQSGGLQQAGATGAALGFIQPNGGEGDVRNQDFLDNFVFKFGPGQNQSLQLLFQSHWNRTQYNVGGVPYGYANGSDNWWNAYIGFDAPADLPNFAQVWPLMPGQSAACLAQGDACTAPFSTSDNTENISKIEYDNTFNSSTFLALRLYHINQVDTSYDATGVIDGADPRTPQQDGGSRLGGNVELTKQFDSHNLVTLYGKFEVDSPVFSLTDAALGPLEAEVSGGPVGYTSYFDFIQPANTSAPLTFGGANDCPVAGGCWLYYLNTTKVFPDGTVNPSYNFWPNGVPRIPANYLSNPPNHPQSWAIALRDQITVTDKLHLDLGVRYEGQNLHLPDGSTYGNVGPNYETNYPREWEPRVGLSWQPTKNDAIRFSYGRTADFVQIGNQFTPLNYTYYLANFPNAPSSIPGSDGTGALGFVGPTYNLTAEGNGCGSGEVGIAVPYRACTSYADLQRWANDWFYPDTGNLKTPTYTNEDFSYSHQFGGGYSVKVTPFYRTGGNIPYLGAVAYSINQTTGQLEPLTFRAFYSGVERATGVEFYGTTPQKPYGLSGFVSATYTNAYSSRVPGSAGEDTQPIIPANALQSGNLYHPGYLSPLSVRVGAQYKTKGGLRFNPVIRFDDGYPYNIGSTTPVIVNGVGLNVPSTNNILSVTQPGAAPSSAVQFVDPTNPGNLLAPNIYATRGTPEKALPGTILSSPRTYMDMTVEYTIPHTKNTFGVQVQNVFGLVYGEPSLNPYYQDIATGVPGVETGAIPNAATFASYGYGTASTLTPIQFGNRPFILLPNGQPVTFNVYYQVSL
jgi:hypothetical protein